LWGEVRIGGIESRRQSGVRIDAYGVIELVAVVASEWLFFRGDARVSILWGDPV
jgi:hypothetical protein